MSSPHSRQWPGAVFLKFLINTLGLAPCYILAPVVSLCYFVAAGKERRAILDFHRACEANKKPWLRQNLWIPLRFGVLCFRSWKNFLWFSISLIDRLALRWQGRAPKIQMQEGLDVGALSQGAVFLGAHFGDWTLCAHLLPQSSGSKVFLVMDLSANPQFVKAMSGLQELQFEIIDASEEGLSFLMKLRCALESQGVVCFLADRGPSTHRMTQLAFLGRERGWHLGPFELALRFRKPLYGVFCTKRSYYPTSPYDLTLESLFQPQNAEAPVNLPNAEALAERYVKCLENRVRKSPHLWFNFFSFWSRLSEETKRKV
jgi:predicted LPLAT superfamily acyltransferase